MITRPPPHALVIGGSAGAVGALGQVLPGLPGDGPPVLIVVHVLPSAPSLLPTVFAPRCRAAVVEADSLLPIEVGTIYFAPSDYHLLVEPDERCALSLEPPVLFSRPAIDVLFESAALVYGRHLIGVVLTGASADGARGLQAIHAAGGQTFVQDPRTAEATTMPLAAIHAVPDARVLTLTDLLDELLTLLRPS